MKKIFEPEIWKKLWDEYLKVNPKFSLTFISTSYRIIGKGGVIT
jgi:hypothetical protein